MHNDALSPTNTYEARAGEPSKRQVDAEAMFLGVSLASILIWIVVFAFIAWMLEP
jgi:hypothetical protein